MADQTVVEREEVPTHPEEMRASYTLRVGNSVSLEWRARITPAGVVTIAIATCAIVAVAAWAGTWQGGRRRR